MKGTIDRELEAMGKEELIKHFKDMQSLYVAELICASWEQDWEHAIRLAKWLGIYDEDIPTYLNFPEKGR